MSWIDDYLRAEDAMAIDTKEQQQIELHRASLLKSQGRELWLKLEDECRERLKEYEIKCGSEPRCKVVLEESGDDVFIVHPSERTTHAEVVLKVEHRDYEIEVKHVTPASPASNAAPYVVRSYFFFDCDGKTVSLKTSRGRVGIGEAAQEILKPVLFPQRAAG